MTEGWNSYDLGDLIRSGHPKRKKLPPVPPDRALLKPDECLFADWNPLVLEDERKRAEATWVGMSEDNYWCSYSRNADSVIVWRKSDISNAFLARYQFRNNYKQILAGLLAAGFPEPRWSPLADAEFEREMARKALVRRSTLATSAKRKAAKDAQQ